MPEIKVTYCQRQSRILMDEYELQAVAELELLNSEPDHKPRKASEAPWEPDLNATQRKIFHDSSPFILAYGEKGCRTLDSLIYTSSGLKRLGRMAPVGAKPGFNPIQESVMASQNVPAIANAFWVESDRAAVRVVLEHGGELTGSPRHPVWVCWETPAGDYGFGWEKLSEIKTKKQAGWRFWTPFFGHTQWTSKRGFHPDLAYALGALVGDGSLNFTKDRRSVAFTNQDAECINRVNAGLSIIGAQLSQTAQAIQFNITPAKAIKPFLLTHEVFGLSHEKRIPDAILEGSKESAAAFLSGLFDTDGTIEKAGTVSFCTTSEMLGRDVQDLLAAFGILCVRRERKSASGKPTWTLSVMGKFAAMFGEMIGFTITRKQSRLRKPSPSFRCPNGFNQNRYIYPKPITSALKCIALKSRTGVRKEHATVIHRNRAWHNKHRRLHSFGSVPQPAKVQAFKELYDCGDALEQFLVSDTWLELTLLSDTQAELADLHVPEHHSFLAAGTLNHNSGKSIGCEHKLIRHCFENWDALGLIFTPSIRTGKYGVIHDLETLILPAWEEGISLEWTPSKLDPNTKDRVLRVGNRFGGWSTILQIAIPYEEAIAARVKGLHPSFVLGDELTDCEGRGYFSMIAGQLNRRRNISGPQQYVASCNPKGPSNWVYQIFFEEPTNLETGEKDKSFSVYHVPFHENAHRPEMRDYLQTLERAVKGDPIEHARLIEGKWIERPTGDALFKSYFMAQRHVIGNAALGTGLVPVKGFPCMVGYDLGQVYSAAVFMQLAYTNEGPIWLVFDEVVHLKEKILYKQMANEVVDRMLAWNEALGIKLAWEHIADDSAVNQWRPGGGGSYDAWEFEREFNIASLKHGLPEMKMRGCPKGAGSIEARVRIVQGKLHQDQLLVSDACSSVRDMLLMLEGRKDEAMKPKKTAAGHIHVFDALSYPMLKLEMGGSSVSGSAVASITTV
jgi:hypothetical protein